MGERGLGGGELLSHELGASFLENVYERALLSALTDKGLKAETQVLLKVVFRNRVVGDFYAVTLVENLVIIELEIPLLGGVLGGVQPTR